MMGNFFNRMYNGKNRSDFTPDQLPKNRFALFFDMLKTRLLKLIQVNLMFLVFMLPLLYFIVNYFIGMLMNPEEALAMITPTLLFCIPCLGVAGIGLTGMTYITRNWARDEHAWVWSDFIDTMKQNWKQGLIAGLVDGALLALISYAGLFYAVNSTPGSPTYMLNYVLGWLMVVFLLVLAMVNIYLWPMIITYDLKLRQHFRNALILAVGRLPWSLLFLVITLIPIAAMLVFMDVMMMPMVLYYLLIGFALTSFINVSYTNSAFDRFINPNIEGAPVNQGLREADEEDIDDL